MVFLKPSLISDSDMAFDSKASPCHIYISVCFNKGIKYRICMRTMIIITIFIIVLTNKNFSWFEVKKMPFQTVSESVPKFRNFSMRDWKKTTITYNCWYCTISYLTYYHFQNKMSEVDNSLQSIHQKHFCLGNPCYFFALRMRVHRFFKLLKTPWLLSFLQLQNRLIFA